MEFNNKELLYGHICYKTNVWICTEKSQKDLEQYPIKIKYSTNRMLNYCNAKIDNLQELIRDEQELLYLIDKAYNFCTTPELYEKYKSEYDKKRYQEKIKRGDEMTRQEIGKMRTDKKRNKVLEIIKNLQNNDVKITGENIYKASKYTDEVIPLSTAKRHLKYIRENNLI